MNDVHLPEEFHDFKRKAWIPIVAGRDGNCLDSKYSGVPWLARDERWPVCANCTKAMQLFLQLNLSRLPAVPRGCPDKGLVQLFYCTSSQPFCVNECEAWTSQSEARSSVALPRSVLVRLIDVHDENRFLGDSPVKDAFPPKLIVDWKEADDYPGGDELEEECGITSTVERIADAYAQGFPLQGDKLMGWPAWVQLPCYPTCPECGTQMRLLYQIDSDYNIPYSFGDGGCGYITQCPKHPNNLCFDWQCS